MRQLAERAELPILAAGSYDFDYLERLKAARFPADLPIDSLRYEAHQPPLYYLAAATLYRLTGVLGYAGQILAIRLLSALLGAALILIGYRTASTLFPADKWLPFGVASLLAFNPMLLAVNSAIGNDPAADLIMSVILFESIGLLLRRHPLEASGRFHVTPHRRLGVWIGLAVLTKTTAYAGIVLALVAVFLAGFKRHQRWRAVAEMAVIATVVCGWWLARNMSVYGAGDPLALGRHAALMVAGGQPAAPPIDLTAIQSFLTVTFHSYWGQFGWMGVLLDDRLYQILIALNLAALVGLTLFVLRNAGALRRRGGSRAYSLLLLVVAFALVAAAMVQYSFGSFLQPQGRYLFPAAVPIATMFVLGLRELSLPRQGPAVLVSLALGLVVLDLASLFGYIVPALSSP